VTGWDWKRQVGEHDSPDHASCEQAGHSAWSSSISSMSSARFAALSPSCALPSTMPRVGGLSRVEGPCRPGQPHLVQLGGVLGGVEAQRRAVSQRVPVRGQDTGWGMAVRRRQPDLRRCPFSAFTHGRTPWPVIGLAGHFRPTRRRAPLRPPNRPTATAVDGRARPAGDQSRSRVLAAWAPSPPFLGSRRGGPCCRCTRRVPPRSCWPCGSRGCGTRPPH
jgi:hypothetical protein